MGHKTLFNSNNYVPTTFGLVSMYFFRDNLLNRDYYIKVVTIIIEVYELVVGCSPAFCVVHKVLQYRENKIHEVLQLYFNFYNSNDIHNNVRYIAYITLLQI